jgi:hypothetical protein
MTSARRNGELGFSRAHEVIGTEISLTRRLRARGTAQPGRLWLSCQCQTACATERIVRPRALAWRLARATTRRRATCPSAKREREPCGTGCRNCPGWPQLAFRQREDKPATWGGESLCEECDRRERSSSCGRSIELRSGPGVGSSARTDKVSMMIPSRLSPCSAKRTTPRGLARPDGYGPRESSHRIA